MTASKVHITSGMAWANSDCERRSYAGEQGPPFKGAQEQPKPRMSGGVWQAFGLCVWFYFIGAAVLVEIFRPEWVRHLLRVMGVTP